MAQEPEVSGFQAESDDISTSEDMSPLARKITREFKETPFYMRADRLRLYQQDYLDLKKRRARACRLVIVVGSLSLALTWLSSHHRNVKLLATGLTSAAVAWAVTDYADRSAISFSNITSMDTLRSVEGRIDYRLKKWSDEREAANTNNQAPDESEA